MRPFRPALSRPLVRLGLIAFVSVFVAGPTPGDVGGCTNNFASSEHQIQPSADGTRSAEFNYFDQGLCSHMCWRLAECELICSALNRPDTCDDTDESLAEAIQACVRGNELRADVFRFTQCPHFCPSGSRYSVAYQWDVEACGHAMLQRSCDDFVDIFSNLPTECVNPCIVSP